MISSIYDSKTKGIYRDRVNDFLIDRLCRSESMTNSHYHPYFELFYLSKGKCRIFADHSLFSVNEGDLVILPPSTLHRTQYENIVERITVSFTPFFIKNFFESSGEINFTNKIKTCRLSFTEDTKAELEQIFETLIREEESPDQFSVLNKKSLLMKLLVILARNFNEKTDFADSSTAIEKSIQKAAEYIFYNFKNDITLEEAADIAGLRDTYFSRMFQEVTGYGFKEYLSHLRLQHSQKLLLNSKLSVTEIALECGFSNSNYFGDVFKKDTGLSPREFRKQGADS